MSGAARRVLGFADLDVAVASDEPRDLTWLNEFLCPWFEDRGGDAEPEVEVALIHDGDAYAATLALGSRPGPPAPAFRADGAPMTLDPPISQRLSRETQAATHTRHGQDQKTEDRPRCCYGQHLKNLLLTHQ